VTGEAGHIPMRVAVVAEYYPRPSHPGLGIWAHRQALAVRDEGVDVRVLALDRPVPPLSVLRALSPTHGGPDLGPLREWARGVRAQPRSTTLDGIPVRYVRFVSPPRPLSYGSWGSWAAPSLGRALSALEPAWPIDVIHAHYAVPAGAAARRWISRGSRRPLVVSVHGGDLTYAAPRTERGWAAVADTLRAADAVLVNSQVTREGVEALIGSRDGLRVVHPGADLVKTVAEPRPQPTLVTVAHLEPHKSQADVIRALATLGGRFPGLRYVLVGKGPQRAELEALAHRLGVVERIEFRGALPHDQAVAELARCHLHVMPSRHDGFGVAHIDAMGAGLPTIGGEGTGAEDIARAGEGIVLVRPGDVGALARTIEELMGDEERRGRLGEVARSTVFEHFSWQRNGRETAAVYHELGGSR
jgi:teichuronic acid biosynthesis glycosyltransferase TuaC